jgi:hypothetical protein
MHILACPLPCWDHRHLQRTPHVSLLNRLQVITLVPMVSPLYVHASTSAIAVAGSASMSVW